MARESWLTATHRIVDQEIHPTLEAAGFQHTKNRWSRPRPGGGEDALDLHWSRYERHDSECARFQCKGDDRAKSYVMISDYVLGDDESQIASFANSGRDALAEQILGPLGLLSGYRQWADSVGPELYSLTAPMPTDSADLERLTRRVQFNHRHRWSKPEALQQTLRDDLRSLQLVWELASYSVDDRYLRRRIADAFDERGFYRAWVP